MSISLEGRHRSVAEQRRRPRLLLLAYACCPGRGSEPGAGWNRALQTARFCDTWVLVDAGQREAIRQHLDEVGEVEGMHWAFVPHSPWERLLSRIPGLQYVAYRSWNRRAARIAEHLHRQISFDLSHLITFCGYREPGYLWKFDLPFVWGPVGGTQNFPWRFLLRAGFLGGGVEMVRSTINSLQLQFSRRVRHAARSAAVVMTANKAIADDLDRAMGVTSVQVIETGVQESHEIPERSRDETEPVHILWAGQCKPHKALYLLLEAIATLPSSIQYRLRVVGDGWQCNRWQRLARRLGVDQNIEWLGWLSHAEVMQMYAWADLFVFTSLRDTTGTVLLEAIAAGLPIVCLDHQGARDVVTERCGVKVPVTTPRAVIQGLGGAIARLADDGDLRRDLGQGARQRVQEFFWSRQAERIMDIYRQVLDDRFVFEDRNGVTRLNSDRPRVSVGGPAVGGPS